MLDKNDLQAIAELMDERIGTSESRMIAAMDEKIGASESRMIAAMDEKIGASESRMLTAMDEKIDASESRMIAAMDEKIGASESRMIERINDSESRMLAMMEAYFEPRFNLLGDQLKLLQEKMLPREALDDLESRTDVLEVVVKQHSREIEELRKAQ